jgi:putative hemolysin
MLLPALILFLFFLLLSAFFSSSETAFIAASPYKINYLSEKGNKRAGLVQQLLKNIDRLLATILIGNTLVNTAAASVATFIFVTFIPNKNQAVLLATVTTTLLILALSEITPKTYAAYNPIRLSLLFVKPIRIFIFIFYPLVRFFTVLSRMAFPSSQKKMIGLARTFDEEEMRILLAMGVKGMSSIRKKMISGVLDIGSRPVREIMIPRPQVKALNMDSTVGEILESIQTGGYSRFPVYRNRLDNIEGVIHAKDIIPYLIDSKAFSMSQLLRKPLFVPETATLEKVLLQMQETTNHLVFVVDEFGNMEGIVTLEDILEEIVGEIQDEYDGKAEEWCRRVEEDVYIVKGNAPIKEVNEAMSVDLPARAVYTTLAGFFLYEFGKIPREGDVLDFKGIRFVIDKMVRSRISFIKIMLRQSFGDEDENEGHRQE